MIGIIGIVYAMPILCQIVRPELRASGYGLMNMISISCGGLADWSLGKMGDNQVPLSMTIRNHLATSDSIARTR